MSFRCDLEQLPEELIRLLNGEQLEAKQQEVFLLQTVTEDQWPHTAAISVGEIVALSPSIVRLALWKHTATSGNLARTRQGMVVIYYHGKAYYIRLQVTEKDFPSIWTTAAQELVVYEAKIHGIKIDEAQYAAITSGIQIRLHEPERVLERWKDTINQLKERD